MLRPCAEPEQDAGSHQEVCQLYAGQAASVTGQSGWRQGERVQAGRAQEGQQDGASKTPSLLRDVSLIVLCLLCPVAGQVKMVSLFEQKRLRSYWPCYNDEKGSPELTVWTLG